MYVVYDDDGNDDGCRVVDDGVEDGDGCDDDDDDDM